MSAFTLMGARIINRRPAMLANSNPKGYWTERELEKAIDRLERQQDQLGDEKIRLGRGRETLRETAEMDDPLSKAQMDIYYRLQKLKGLREEYFARRNPIANVTDRALRYRANAEPPAGPRVCEYCGSRRNVEIGHRDGHEENNVPHNLVWTCRACNTRMGIAAVREGWGRRTRQYNAAPTYQQYAMAVSKHQRGSHDEWGKMIHETPHSLRSEYARRIWDTRRSRGTDREEVPF